MRYLDKSFKIRQSGDGKYQDNWERTFGSKLDTADEEEFEVFHTYDDNYSEIEIYFGELGEYLFCTTNNVLRFKSGTALARLLRRMAVWVEAEEMKRR